MALACWSLEGGDVENYGGHMTDNWTAVLGDSRYQTFEDPFSGMAVPKAEFNAVYGPACLAIFLGEIEVGLLFDENPMVEGEWRFSDDNARADLYDVAVELRLVRDFDEVCAGESDEEKSIRLSPATPPSALQPKKSTQGGTHAGSPAEKQVRLDKVISLLMDGSMSSKRRKKLERERRGLSAALAHAEDSH